MEEGGRVKRRQTAAGVLVSSFLRFGLVLGLVLVRNFCKVVLRG